jgi:predicted NBD/HSP70 family sugar kinase
MPNRFPTGSPRLLRRLNSAAVLRAIRAHGPISRAELARATGLSKPTVRDVVELLLRQGYVLEREADGDARPRRPGPRARLLTFNGRFGHVVGIDIGANKVLALVADLTGEVEAVERRRTGLRERRDPEALLSLVADAAGRALAAAGAELESVRAVGVGTPGVVDPESGRVTLAPQLGGWEGIALARRLGERFPCPLLVDNEVRLALLAERWRGAAQGVDHALLVQIGVGIGGGALIGGDVYRGAGGAAGEIGYLPLFADEEPSEGLGPFEHAAGGTAFARLGRRAVAEGRGETLLALAGGDPEAIDAEVVFAAAAAGDATAQGIVDELLERLARGIAAAVVVLNPAVLILGGGVARAGAPLLEPIERRVRQLVPVPPQVVLSSLGDEAVALGAVRLALQEVEARMLDLTAPEAV